MSHDKVKCPVYFAEMWKIHKAEDRGDSDWHFKGGLDPSIKVWKGEPQDTQLIPRIVLSKHLISVSDCHLSCIC